jgi:hypothetical protein
MPECFDPLLDVLPPAQRHLWLQLAPAASLGFVLYGGTAVALHLGHRQSVDFDFFAAEPLEKVRLMAGLPMLKSSAILFEDRNSFVVSVDSGQDNVKLSFFGGLTFGRLHPPLQSRDGVLLVASRDDLLATKLKALLDRAEAKDYRDIAALIVSGSSLATGLAGARAMFRAEPRTILLAIGYFEDGDVASLTAEERRLLLEARDAVEDLPAVEVRPGSLAVPLGPCDA